MTIKPAPVVAVNLIFAPVYESLAPEQPPIIAPMVLRALRWLARHPNGLARHKNARHRDARSSVNKGVTVNSNEAAVPRPLPGETVPANTTGAA